MRLRGSFWPVPAMLVLASILCGVERVKAADGFPAGWELDAGSSWIRFRSVKNAVKVESSSFATIQGEISQDGQAEVVIALDSVDTGIDLRNVRMRFLFFESFTFPEARITAKLDPGVFGTLPTARRISLPVTYSVDLHGVVREMEIDTVVTLLTEEIVIVAGSSIIVPVETFNLGEGLMKLQEAAKVEILPAGAVSFELAFKRLAPDPAAAKPAAAAAAPAPAVEVAKPSAALETAGVFSKEECVGRFEIISRTGAIRFASGSATLDPASGPFLKALTDVIERCPSLSLTVAGHTDADGAAAANQALSEARAESVVAYLALQGVALERLSPRGYGESRPVAPNDSPRNKRLNRRIEFVIE